MACTEEDNFSLKTDLFYVPQVVDHRKAVKRDFSGGPVVKNPPANAGDMSSIPGPETKNPHAVG